MKVGQYYIGCPEICTLFTGGHPDGHEFIKTSQEISTKIKAYIF